MAGFQDSMVQTKILSSCPRCGPAHRAQEVIGRQEGFAEQVSCSETLAPSPC